MHKFIFSKLILIIIFTFNSSAVAEEGKPVFKIGFAIPLSGSLSFIGEDIREGVELATLKNDSANITILPIYEDSEYNNKTTASIANKLISIDKVDAIVSLWDTAEIVAPLAERADIPHIAIRWNPHVAEKYNNTFTIESTYKSYVKMQLEMLKKIGAKKISVIHQSSEGWNLAAEQLKKESSNYNIEITQTQQFTSGTTDFRTLVTKALSKPHDYIVLHTNVPDTAQIVKRLKELSKNSKFTGYFEGDEAINLYESMPYASQFEASEWFKELFQKRYNRQFRTRAPQGYDIISILYKIHEGKEKLLNTAEIVSSLKNLNSFSGASGTLSARGGKTFANDCVVKVFKDGKVQKLELNELSSFKIN